MKRRTLLAASSGLLALKAPAMSRTPAASSALPDLQEASAVQLAAALQAGRTTAEARCTQPRIGLNVRSVAGDGAMGVQASALLLILKIEKKKSANR